MDADRLDLDEIDAVADLGGSAASDEVTRILV
jgi:hypothetical protein